MKVAVVSFRAQPKSYRKIDEYVSRSAQPEKDDFSWLKKQGVTDIINFRRMFVPSENVDEKEIVENLGMHYHNIPSITGNPTEENVGKFLDVMDNVRKSGGKAHIHSKDGVDRTGMYSFIYKSKYKVGSVEDNLWEMYEMGHHAKKFPDLVYWMFDYISRFNKKF